MSSGLFFWQSTKEPPLTGFSFQEKPTTEEEKAVSKSFKLAFDRYCDWKGFLEDEERTVGKDNAFYRKPLEQKSHAKNIPQRNPGQSTMNF